MTTLLAWLLMLTDPLFPFGGISTLPDPDVGRLAEFAKGRVLFYLIRRGMTEEEVERLLGPPEFFGPLPTNDPGHWCSYRAGVNVSFGRGRVTSLGVSRVVVETTDPCIWTMLGQPAKGDRGRTSPFFTALATLGRKYGEDYLPPGVDEGFAAEVPFGYVLAVLGEASPFTPGRDMQHLLLLDRQGRLLDRLSCSISNRLTGMPVGGGTFRTQFPAGPQADDARAVIRYTPPKGRTVAGNWSHEVTWQGKTYSFRWDQTRPAEWQEMGLSRVGVRSRQFVILFPALERATISRSRE
jgi:hypothetical protein